MLYGVQYIHTYKHTLDGVSTYVHMDTMKATEGASLVDENGKETGDEKNDGADWEETAIILNV